MKKLSSEVEWPFYNSTELRSEPKFSNPKCHTFPSIPADFHGKSPAHPAEESLSTYPNKLMVIFKRAQKTTQHCFFLFNHIAYIFEYTMSFRDPFISALCILVAFSYFET